MGEISHAIFMHFYTHRKFLFHLKRGYNISMADFDKEQAYNRQHNILGRTEELYKSLRDDVVNYYWERSPQDEEEEIDNYRGMRKYLRSAYEKLDYILRDVERDLEI